MVSSSSSSFSFSPTSSISFDDVSVEPAPPSIKFLCSYGGKILPRRSDGKLSYVGGHNRVLAVHRGVSFSELQAKLRELCGWNTVSLRCQLPTEDMDTLVSVTCDEDLANLVQEYYGIDGRDRTVKIRAFAFHPQVPAIKMTPDTPLLSGAERISGACVERCINQSTAAARFYGQYEQLDASAAAGEFTSTSSMDVAMVQPKTNVTISCITGILAIIIPHTVVVVGRQWPRLASF